MGHRGRDPAKWRLLMSHALRNKKVILSLIFLLAFCAFLAVFSSGGSSDLQALSLKDLVPETMEQDSVIAKTSNESSVQEVLKELEKALNNINARKDEDEIPGNKFDPKKKLGEIITKGRKKPVRNKNSPPNACQKNGVKTTSRKDDGFQSAGDDLVVYSAYFNTRVAAETKDSFIKIVGLARPDLHVYCHVWYRVEKENRRELEIVEALVEHQGGDDMSIQSVVLKCKVPNHPYQTWTPRWVVLSDSPCGIPSVVLPIKDPGKYITQSTDYAVCLQKPLTADYTSIQQFIEWVEVNRVLGAKHFTVYTFNASDLIMPYVQYYVDNGLMDYKEWDMENVLPGVPLKASRVALISDCIFHNIHAADHLAILDVTSFPVSYKDADMPKLLNNGPCEFKSAVKFSSVFFSPSLPRDAVFTTNPEVSATELGTLSQTRRTQYKWPCDFLSQMIVKPEMVFKQDGGLTSEEMMPDACCMPDTQARLYHYRDWDSPPYVEWNYDSPTQTNNAFDDELAKKLVIDRRLHQYAGNIIQGVADAYRAVDPQQFKRFARLTDKGSWSLS